MKRDSQFEKFMRHLVPERRLAFVAESVRVLKDVRTRYTNQPKARVFSWNCLLPVGRFRKLDVDVEHEEAEGLSQFACRGCVQQLDLTKRKVDKVRADFFSGDG